MRILFLCHRLPFPPKRGGKIRPFNMIRHLGRRHEVTVATVARSGAELEEGQGLRQHCAALHVGRIGPLAAWSRFARFAPTAYPSTFGYFYSPELEHTVQGLLRTVPFDAVLVHCSSMGPYVAEHAGCRKVMDFGDADSEKWFEYGRRALPPLGLGFRLEGAKVRRWERRLGERFDACSVISPREREVLSAHVARPIEVIPNGVDLDYFSPAAGAPAPHPRRLIFTGNMSYKPNIDAVRHLVRDILPLVRRSVPEVELHIVGMDPTPAVRRLADGARVVVTGRVDDVRPYFDSATVAVAPLRIARGLQNKVLEAMAAGKVVIASSEAVAGMRVVDGEQLIIADTPERFASAALEVIRDASLRESLEMRARFLVESEHDWKPLLQKLVELVETVGGRENESGKSNSRAIANN